MSTNIQLWRVENEFGCGPYNGDGNIKDFLSANYRRAGFEDWRCPVPWKDKDLSKIFTSRAKFQAREELRSAFSTTQQYQNWFSTEFVRNALDATGFFLTQYHVAEDAVHVGYRQSLFDPKDATIAGIGFCNRPEIITTRDEVQDDFVDRFLERTLIDCSM